MLLISAILIFRINQYNLCKGSEFSDRSDITFSFKQKRNSNRFETTSIDFHIRSLDRLPKSFMDTVKENIVLAPSL